MKTVYIIGIGRSGTTLLNSLLGNHSLINTTPENYFATFFYRSYHKKKNFTNEDFKRVDSFNLSFHKLQPIIGYDYSMRTSSEQKIKGGYKEFCDAVYNCYRHQSNYQENAVYCIDKNPVNTLHLEKILKYNPDAKFIFITRDYRANILSRIQSVHIHSTDPIYNGLRWNFFMKNAIKFRSAHPSKIFQLKYENLVENPKVIIREILEFLKLPQEEIALDQQSEKVVLQNPSSLDQSDRLKKKYTDLTSPVSVKRRDAWKRHLPLKTIRKLDVICQPYGSELGYRTVHPISFFTKLLYLTMSIPMRFKLTFNLLKDRLTNLLPINIKIARFKKFVSKIELTRNERR